MEQVTHRARHIGVLQVGIILLAAFTAGVHLYLSSEPDEDLRLWFLLNGLGYLGLVAALYLPQFAQFHHIVRLILIVYTALTIVMWILMADHSSLDPLDAVTKAAEIVLLVLLLIEERTQKRLRV
ncbi:MAG TPA: hypothetical protein VL485_14415 [Ktedonobacteraceae bacterium]|nr:hypothetical protein [Ktedonobacteraceae bacterium]